jgi:hypothetical protein
MNRDRRLEEIFFGARGKYYRLAAGSQSKGSDWLHNEGNHKKSREDLTLLLFNSLNASLSITGSLSL